MKFAQHFYQGIRFQFFLLFILCASLLSVVLNLEAESLQPVILQVKNREIVVNGKKSQVFEIVQPNGIQGLFLQKGNRFYVILENHLDRPTGVHWHGLILPNSQDGVPFVTQPPIPSGGKYLYDFSLIQAGSFWMHAHYGLQEQKLLTAPLILHEPSHKNSQQQEVVMFLSDFTFQNPLDIFKNLQSKASQSMPSDQKMMMHADLNDVKYDAFLTNWRTLSNPEMVGVKLDQEIRLRIINGASSSNFFIQLGNLKGKAIAVDGSNVQPFVGNRFEIATAQRLDIRFKIPAEGGAYPIFAQGEGLKMRTNLFLATSGAKIPQFTETADQAMGAQSYQQEFLLKAKSPLAQKEVQRRLIVNLEGNMAKYIWTINGKAWPLHDPLVVKQGEQVELIFVNQTLMSHPMHLHGHVFQVTEINGQPLAGALRDTILVLPKATVKVQFDANNPGCWPLHCHNLYHLYAGMMTTLTYEGFKGPVFSLAEIEHEYQNQ